VLVKLPENKNMIIDSKLSLNAYESFVSAEDDEQRKKALNAHLTSVRKHIKELSEKSYQNLYELQSLDFVLMFIPIEPALGLAVQNDVSLFEDAFKKNIVIVSPSTLLATLRTIANIWKQEKQNRNAMEIARQSGELYDKFVGFLEDLEKLGKNIETTKNTYDSAFKKLGSGRGNLIRRVERIKELGANSSKEISQNLLDNADE
jgi:DNA recombination protein RmuC